MTDEARQRVEREMCQDEDLARLLLEASTVLDEPYHHEAIAAHLVAASNYITRLTSLLAQARETNGRLNRRCQIAEAAANLQAEKWDTRSNGAGRAYIYDLALSARGAEIVALRQRAEQAEAESAALVARLAHAQSPKADA
jgi:hypothetical protein